MPRRYSVEFRDRAVRLVQDRLHEDHGSSEAAAVMDTAFKLGIGKETLRRWLRQAEIDADSRPGVSRENVELRRTNEILKLASVFS